MTFTNIFKNIETKPNDTFNDFLKDIQRKVIKFNYLFLIQYDKPVLAAKSPRVTHGKGPCVPHWLGMTEIFLKIPSQKSLNSFPNQNHPVLAAKFP